MTDTERNILDEGTKAPAGDLLYGDPAGEAEPPKRSAKSSGKTGNKKKKERERRKAGVGTWIYRIVLLALVGVLAFSATKVATIYSGYQAGTKVYDKVVENTIAVDEASDEIKIDWDALLAQNDDVVAWIRCPDTVINYPVVQGEDNEYYLEFLINGEWNAKGTPFVDAHCPAPFSDYLTIIYGHRMKDGSMFASLLNYFDDTEYYGKHPVIELYTPAANYNLEIVSGAKIDSADSTYYRFGEFTLEERQQYAGTITAANRILGFSSDTVLDGSERLVMLSTCTPQSDNFRFVIWGKLTPME